VESVFCGDADTLLCVVGARGEGSGLGADEMLAMDGLCTGPTELGADTGGTEEEGTTTGETVAGDDEAGEALAGLCESTGLAGACDASPDTGGDGEFGAILVGTLEAGPVLADGRIESGLVAGAMAVVGEEPGCCDDGSTWGLETGATMGASTGGL
jgi:hypothetical protein